LTEPIPGQPHHQGSSPNLCGYRLHAQVLDPLPDVVAMHERHASLEGTGEITRRGGEVEIRNTNDGAEFVAQNRSAFSSSAARRSNEARSRLRIVDLARNRPR
jgi:hypothetical protein